MTTPVIQMLRRILPWWMVLVLVFSVIHSSAQSAEAGVRDAMAVQAARQKSIEQFGQKNIRTWGQLGIGGEWHDKAIHVYGYGLRYLFAPRFSDDVLKGSDKWNESLQQYVNLARTDGTLESADQQMADELAKDRRAPSAS